MPIPVISVAQMREWENASWAAGLKEGNVIARVGEHLARRLLELSGCDDKILIIAGKGHNGDDARAMLPHLKGKRDAALLDVIDPRTALQEFKKTNAASFSFLVDALFGIGLSRPLDSDWQQLIETINRSGVPILSVDVPSGLNAQTGAPEGASIRAAMTLTVGAAKRGLLDKDAVPFVGRLEVLPDVGLLPCTEGSDLQWITADDFKNFPPPRLVSAHKGSFGHVSIIAGSLGYHGAAVLSSHGALRARPGLVTLFPQENVYLPVAAQSQAAMVHPWEPVRALPENTTALLFGPGLAARDLREDVKTELRSFWRELPLPIVADASALDWLPTGETAKALRVITPHPGEAARMLKISVPQVQNDRLAALRELSKVYGNCWVVLKGHQTLVGRSTDEIYVNSSGNPFLAQGGTGDILSGFLAGLLAQPPLQPEPWKTIAYAVWRHGNAADELIIAGKKWTVEDLVRTL